MSLADDIRATLQRHSRAITDHGGVIPDGLVGDLLLIAETHAAQSVEQAVTAASARTATRKTTTREKA